MSASTNASDRNRTVLFASVAAALVVLLAFGGWLWSRRASEPSTDDVKISINRSDGKPIEFNGVKLGPGGEVSAADQKRLMANAAVHRTQMLEEYFKLQPGKERKDHLDKLIDQQEQVRKMMEEQNGPSTKPTGAAATPGTQPTQRVIIKAKADPKMATEGMPPGDRARLAEMMADINARRAERGLPPQNGFMMVRMNK